MNSTLRYCIVCHDAMLTVCPTYSQTITPNLTLYRSSSCSFPYSLLVFSSLFSVLFLHNIIRPPTQRHKTVKLTAKCWLSHQSMRLRPVSVSGRNGRPCSCSDRLRVSTACSYFELIQFLIYFWAAFWQSFFFKCPHSFPLVSYAPLTYNLFLSSPLPDFLSSSLLTSFLIFCHFFTSLFVIHSW